jgi:hypothetical protein
MSRLSFIVWLYLQKTYQLPRCRDPSLLFANPRRTTHKNGEKPAFFAPFSGADRILAAAGCRVDEAKK